MIVIAVAAARSLRLAICALAFLSSLSAGESADRCQADEESLLQLHRLAPARNGAAGPSDQDDMLPLYRWLASDMLSLGSLFTDEDLGPDFFNDSYWYSVDLPPLGSNITSRVVSAVDVSARLHAGVPDPDCLIDRLRGAHPDNPLNMRPSNPPGYPGYRSGAASSPWCATAMQDLHAATVATQRYINFYTQQPIVNMKMNLWNGRGWASVTPQQKDLFVQAYDMRDDMKICVGNLQNLLNWYSFGAFLCKCNDADSQIVKQMASDARETRKVAKQAVNEMNRVKALISCETCHELTCPGSAQGTNAGAGRCPTLQGRWRPRWFKCFSRGGQAGLLELQASFPCNATPAPTPRILDDEEYCDPLSEEEGEKFDQFSGGAEGLEDSAMAVADAEEGLLDGVTGSLFTDELLEVAGLADPEFLLVGGFMMIMQMAQGSDSAAIKAMLTDIIGKLDQLTKLMKELAGLAEGTLLELMQDKVDDVDKARNYHTTRIDYLKRPGYGNEDIYGGLTNFYKSSAEGLPNDTSFCNQRMDDILLWSKKNRPDNGHVIAHCLFRSKFGDCPATPPRNCTTMEIALRLIYYYDRWYEETLGSSTVNPQLMKNAAVDIGNGDSNEFASLYDVVDKYMSALSSAETAIVHLDEGQLSAPMLQHFFWVLERVYLSTMHSLGMKMNALLTGIAMGAGFKVETLPDSIQFDDGSTQFIPVDYQSVSSHYKMLATPLHEAYAGVYNTVLSKSGVFKFSICNRMNRKIPGPDDGCAHRGGSIGGPDDCAYYVAYTPGDGRNFVADSPDNWRQPGLCSVFTSVGGVSSSLPLLQRYVNRCTQGDAGHSHHPEDEWNCDNNPSNRKWYFGPPFGSRANLSLRSDQWFVRIDVHDLKKDGPLDDPTSAVGHIFQICVDDGDIEWQSEASALPDLPMLPIIPSYDYFVSNISKPKHPPLVDPDGSYECVTPTPWLSNLSSYMGADINACIAAVSFGGYGRLNACDTRYMLFNVNDSTCACCRRQDTGSPYRYVSRPASSGWSMYDLGSYMLHERKRCLKEKWQVQAISRKDAEAKCASDPGCGGLMWYRACDGRSAISGWYEGCGGDLEEGANADWDTIDKPSDGVSWASATVHKNKRCTKELWQEPAMLLSDAKQKCASDDACRGLMWYNHCDGREANSGWYEGCDGTELEDVSNPDWDTINRSSFV